MSNSKQQSEASRKMALAALEQACAYYMPQPKPVTGAQLGADGETYCEYVHAA